MHFMWDIAHLNQIEVCLGVVQSLQPQFILGDLYNMTPSGDINTADTGNVFAIKYSPEVWNKIVKNLSQF